MLGQQEVSGPFGKAAAPQVEGLRPNLDLRGPQLDGSRNWTKPLRGSWAAAVSDPPADRMRTTVPERL